MGSGPSKEKDSDTRGTTQNTARTEPPTSRKQNGQNSVKKIDNVSNSNFRTSEKGHKQQNGDTKKFEKSVNNNNKVSSRIPQPFSDSDDDGDDILRDEWKSSRNKISDFRGNGVETNSNNSVRTWQPPQPSTGEYPETYAQRMQREQYKHDQFLRQKTIYRDPDEWKAADQLSQQSFDVSKFKEANKTMPKTDIFGTLSTNDYTMRQFDDNNYYETANHKRKQSVPKYDVSEEDLMNDIESHYY